MTATIGAKADGKYTLAVTLPGESEPKRFELAYREGFKTLGWVGFMAMGYEPGVFYVDNVHLAPLPVSRPRKRPTNQENG